MQTKRIQWVALAGALALTSSAWGQMEPPVPDGKAFFFKTIDERGSTEVKTVSGAPYSGDQTTTTTQTLADGNRIVQTSTAKVYRDQQGRTRVEHNLGSIGPLGSDQKHTLIMINDPVAGASYTIDPENHAIRTATVDSGMGPKKRAELTSMARSQMTFTRDGAASSSVLTYKIAPSADLKRTSEDLGTQTMEGLKVTGTRTTLTIPAGGEGNELPMQIIDERWYSPELQANIKTIHTDPRMGQTVFTMTNVNRANPDASLFQAPSEDQVSEGKIMLDRKQSAEQ